MCRRSYVYAYNFIGLIAISSGLTTTVSSVEVVSSNPIYAVALDPQGTIFVAYYSAVYRLSSAGESSCAI